MKKQNKLKRTFIIENSFLEKDSRKFPFRKLYLVQGSIAPLLLLTSPYELTVAIIDGLWVARGKLTGIRVR